MPQECRPGTAGTANAPSAIMVPMCRLTFTIAMAGVLAILLYVQGGATLGISGWQSHDSGHCSSHLHAHPALPGVLATGNGPAVPATGHAIGAAPADAPDDHQCCHHCDDECPVVAALPPGSDDLRRELATGDHGGATTMTSGRRPPQR
jgi:hypothetical protein